MALVLISFHDKGIFVKKLSSIITPHYIPIPRQIKDLCGWGNNIFAKSYSKKRFMAGYPTMNQKRVKTRKDYSHKSRKELSFKKALASHWLFLALTAGKTL